MFSISEVLEFLYHRLQAEGYALSDKSKVHVRSSIENLNALPDSVIDEINGFISRSSPTSEIPEWLSAIDSYFDSDNSTSNPKVDKFHLHQQFVVIITIMSPLVFLDRIFSMKAFSVSFLSSLELAFMTRLQLPRNKLEANQIYDYILSLPAKPKKKLFRRSDKFDPPYKAQMLFAALIMSESKSESDLWNFQLECLKYCPEHLIDYPHIQENRGSYRPAFWMAHFVEPSKFRNILAERASDEFNRCLKEVIKYEKEKEQATAELSPSSVISIDSLRDLVPMKQQELVNLLEEFEALLSKHHPDVSSKLRPGVDPKQIDKLNEILAPLMLPDDLTTLFLWHNGIENDGFLFGFPDFYSIEEALQQYRQTIDILGEFGWCKAWFTISYESRVYRLSPLSESRQEESPVFYYDLESGDIEVNHQSVKQFVQTLIQAYRTGVMALDESSGYRDCNMDEFEKLRIAYSPNAYIYPENESPCYNPSDPEEWPKEWKRYYVCAES